MNFILFTNQGYPLQNSSLGQLHSDGGVVSIDSSSAERLLLVYLPACQLRSSGYYPKYKMAPFQVVFEPGERKEATGTEIRRIRGLGKHRNAFLCQKFIDGECRVTWEVVVVQHPSACNAWSHKCHPFHGPFKDFPITSLIHSLSWWQKFLVDDSLTGKKRKSPHRFDFGFAHSRFLGTGGVCSVPLPTLAFSLGVVLQNPLFITCDNATEEFWLPLKAVQKIKRHIPPIGLLLSREVLWNHLGAYFSHV